MNVTVDDKPVSGVVGYLNAIRAMRSLQYPKTPKGFLYGSMDEMLLALGRSFTPAPLPKGVRRGRMKMCYMNAANLVMDNPELVYCEGYAAGILPVMHAFCVTRKGAVVDPTWKDGTEYFGVPIKREFLRKTLLRNKVYGVLDDWKNEWPLCRLPSSEWLEAL